VPSLTSYHTFALPASCQRLIEITHLDELRILDIKEPFCVLGEGSNTIFIENFAGSVIVMKTKGVYIEPRPNDTFVRVAAGENWHLLVEKLVDMDIGGLENLALIPGTVGAAPVQNIGAYGVELAQFVEYVQGYDLKTLEMRKLSNSQCQFGYRDSIFKHELKERFIITEVGLALPNHWRPNLSYGPLAALSPDNVGVKHLFETVIAIRQSKLPDPKIQPNAGSFFKNPVVSETIAAALQRRFPDMPSYPADSGQIKLAAGWLIEQAGLKGFSLNGVQVYEKQALVLVNQEHANGDALKAMIDVIQRKVSAKFGVNLVHEVRLIAATGEVALSVE